MRLALTFFFLMIRRPPRSTLSSSSAASDVYKRQGINAEYMGKKQIQIYNPFFAMQACSILKSISSSSIDTLCSASTEPCAQQKKYSRICPQIRQQLFDLIFFNGKKIKEAASQLKINYSSAKTILHLYRKKIKKQILKTAEKCSTKSCGYKSGCQQIEVISSRGGRVDLSATVATKFITKHKEQKVAENLKNSALNIHQNSAFKFCTKNISDQF
eukprot:TRINITY_DN1972_c0_g1_i1.p1 TRINITY_DN1972_c0_g1~~TRINITY_DN1972_c0_g1_i1.p1  ORF type:complete len:215 (+),score=37.49 TRINITY_DN1972_c0_g1_i1:59-703(+)